MPSLLAVSDGIKQVPNDASGRLIATLSQDGKQVPEIIAPAREPLAQPAVAEEPVVAAAPEVVPIVKPEPVVDAPAVAEDVTATIVDCRARCGRACRCSACCGSDSSDGDCCASASSIDASTSN